MNIRFPFVGRRGSGFAKALAAYGFDKCSQRAGKLLIGVPAMDGLDPIEAIPKDLTAIAFLAAPVQVALINSFANDPLAKQVEQLAIGTSHYYAQKRLGDYDMRAAIAAVDQPLPKLRKAVLGDMSQLFNGGQYYGKLGDVAAFIGHSPALEELELYGQFELSAPITHGALRTLYAAADSIGVSGGPISQQTITHVMQSNCAALEDLTLELEEEDLEQPYDLPSGFAGRDIMPKLKRLYLDPVNERADEALKQWRAERV